MMRTLFAATLALGAIVGSAEAMPVAPSGAQGYGDVIAVAGGCGAGWHRGPYGGCRKNFADPAAHACPRGYHIGPVTVDAWDWNYAAVYEDAKRRGDMPLQQKLTSSYLSYSDAVFAYSAMP